MATGQSLPDGVMPNLAEAMQLLTAAQTRLDQTVYLLQARRVDFNPAPFKRLGAILDEAHLTASQLVLRASKRP